MRSRRWARALTGALGLLAITGTAGASPPVWQPQATLQSSSGSGRDVRSLAVQGDTILLGPSDILRENGQPRGLVEVFGRTDLAWTRRTTLDLGPDVHVLRTALDGDTAAVLTMHDEGPEAPSPRTLHVFSRAGDDWTPQTRIPFAPIRAFFDLALSHDTLLLGGRIDSTTDTLVQVLARSGASWSEQGTLPVPPGHVGDRRVSLDGDTAVLGFSWLYSEDRADQPAYVFVRSGDTWTRQATLEPSEPIDRRNFGTNVAIHGDTALVSAVGSGVPDNPGAVYVFHRTGTDWKQQARLQPSDAPAGLFVGTAIGLQGERALVSWISAEKDTDGAVDVFTRSGDQWNREARLRPSEFVRGDVFGHPLAFDGQTAVVRLAPGLNGDTRASSAHVFTLAAPVGDPCGPGLPACAVACVRGACADGSEAHESEGGCATSLPGQRAPATVALAALGLVAARCGRGGARRPSHPPLAPGKGRRRGSRCQPG